MSFDGLRTFSSLACHEQAKRVEWRREEDSNLRGSYDPTAFRERRIKPGSAIPPMAPQIGFEPTTSTSATSRSYPLSYGGKILSPRIILKFSFNLKKTNLPFCGKDWKGNRQDCQSNLSLALPGKAGSEASHPLSFLSP